MPAEREGRAERLKDIAGALGVALIASTAIIIASVAWLPRISHLGQPLIGGDKYAVPENEGGAGQSNDSMLLPLTLILNGLTLAVLFSQAIIFRGQRHLMRRQLEAATNAAAASNAQARIAEQTISVLEQPYLFPICKHNFVDVLVTRASRLSHAQSEVALGTIPRVDFVLKNYGRTPAILRYVNAKIEAGKTAPNEHTAYPLVDMPAELVVQPGDRTTDMHAGMSAFTAHMSREDHAALAGGADFLWFFGYVVFDDLCGARSELHFCWRYDHSLRVFQPCPPERNEVTRRAKPLAHRPVEPVTAVRP